MRWNTDSCACVMLICVGLSALVLAPKASGRPFALEPGLFPNIVASILCVLGLLLGARAHFKRGAQRANIPMQRLRPYLVLVAVAAFGILIRPVGLTGATCALVLLSGSASSGSRPRELVVVALTLAGAGVLVFSVLLGLPMGW